MYSFDGKVCTTLDLARLERRMVIQLGVGTPHPTTFSATHTILPFIDMYTHGLTVLSHQEIAFRFEACFTRNLLQQIGIRCFIFSSRSKIDI